MVLKPFDSARPPAQKIAKPPFVSAFSTARPTVKPATMKIHFVSSDILHHFMSFRVISFQFMLVHVTSYHFMKGFGNGNGNVILLEDFNNNVNVNVLLCYVRSRYENFII